jgi:transposase-like protein
MKENLLPGHHEYRRYSDSTRKLIVQEYKSSGHSMQYLQKKFGIRSTSTIFYWIKSAENEAKESYLSAKKTLTLMVDKNFNEPVQIQKLKQRIKELERELEDSRLLTEAYRRMIEKAEEELKIPIRKKHNTK